MYLTLPGEFSTLNANSKLTVKPQPAATPKPTATSKSCQTYHGLGGIGAWNTIARPPHPGGWGIQPKQRHWPSSVGSRIPSKFQLEGQMDKACKPPVDLDLLPNHWVMSFLCRTLCSEKILYTEFCIRKLRRLIYFHKIKIILTHPAAPGSNPGSTKIFLGKIPFTA